MPKSEECNRDCGDSAECKYSDEYGKHVCVCKAAYEGNHIRKSQNHNELGTKHYIVSSTAKLLLFGRNHWRTTTSSWLVIRGCTDKNECVDGTHDCTANAFCTNIPGFWKCSCSDGFTGLGYGNFSCADVDECEERKHNCRGLTECTNKLGGFGCKCPDGYKVFCIFWNDADCGL